MNYINYIEKRKHGTATFPIEYYYVDKTHPRYVMNAHWHREFEIMRVLSGSFTVYLNNTEYTLKKDDILLMECGCLHRGQPTECVYECIVVDLNMLLPQQDGLAKQFISQMINSQVNIESILSPKDSDLYHTATELFSFMRSAKPYYELSVYGLLFTLISQIYSHGYIFSANHTHSNRQIEVIGLVLEWINQNFKEPINSQTLSQISNLNFNYLCKIFKKFTGQTITQYINERRIEHACYDIANNKNITDAAFNNGFNDLSYFAKTFKRYKGITPREFKTLAKRNTGHNATHETNRQK